MSDFPPSPANNNQAPKSELEAHFEVSEEATDSQIAQEQFRTSIFQRIKGILGLSYIFGNYSNTVRVLESLRYDGDFKGTTLLEQVANDNKPPKEVHKEIDKVA